MAYDKELQLADKAAVTAGAVIGDKVVDFGASSNVEDDVFYTVRFDTVPTAAGDIVIQGSKNGTFTGADLFTVATIPVTTSTLKTYGRLPAFGVPRYIRPYSNGAAAAAVTIDASIGIPINLDKRA